MDPRIKPSRPQPGVEEVRSRQRRLLIIKISLIAVVIGAWFCGAYFVYRIRQFSEQPELRYGLVVHRVTNAEAQYQHIGGTEFVLKVSLKTAN